MTQDTFKIFHMISENEASEVYLFNKKFKNEKTSLLSENANNELFNKREMSYITSRTTSYTINENIYSHDSINTIQCKLFKNSDVFNNYVFNSIYMYILSPIKNKLSNEESELNENINVCCDNLEYISLTIQLEDNYIDFINNPYKNTINKKYRVFNNFNKKISMFDLNNNSIYFVTFDDVYDINNNIISNYFPKLFEENIKDKETYLSEKNNLLSKNNIYYNNTVEISWKITDYFNTFLVKNKSITNKINIFEKIKSLTFIKQQPFDIFLPIEILFRKLQTTNEVPLLKLNTGIKTINQYRLYGSYKNNKAEIIPDISLNMINKLYNDLHNLKQKSLSCLIIQEFKGKPVYIIINLLENGKYFLHFQPTKVLDIFNYSFSIENIELLIKSALDLFFNSINNIVLDLPIERFKIDSLYDKDLIIKQITCNYTHTFKDIKAITYNIENVLKFVEFIFKSNKKFNVSLINLEYIYSTVNTFGNPIINIERVNSRSKSYDISINLIQSVDDIELCISFLECLFNILENPSDFYKNFESYGNINWNNIYVPDNKYSDKIRQEFDVNEEEQDETAINKVVSMKDIISRMTSTINKSKFVKNNTEYDLDEPKFDRDIKETPINKVIADQTLEKSKISVLSDSKDESKDESKENSIEKEINTLDIPGLSGTKDESEEKEEKEKSERVKTPVLPDSKDDSKENSIEKEIDTLDIPGLSGSKDESEEKKSTERVKTPVLPDSNDESEEKKSTERVKTPVLPDSNDESEEKKSTERVKTPVLPDSNDESKDENKEDSIEKEKTDMMATLPVETSNASPREEIIDNENTISDMEDNDSELLLGFDDEDSGNKTDSSDFGGGTKDTLRDYLQSRIRDRDPLLVERSEKIYTSPYSRTCPTVNKRQPIILTDEEKETIDKEHPGSYGKALTYSSNSDKKLHYICPRYWCVDENISLKVEDVVREGNKYKSKYCKNSQGNDGTILDFEHKKNHYDKNNNYIYNTPAVGDKSCIPCCFKKSNIVNKFNPQCLSSKDSSSSKETMKEVEQIETEKKLEKLSKETDDKTLIPDRDEIDERLIENRKDNMNSQLEKLKQKLTNQKSISEINKLLKKDDTKLYNYIQQSNKFPLESGKWGYIPDQIEKLFDINNKNCNNNICILRYGVEQDKHQSFLSAMASVYNLNILIHLDKTPTGTYIEERIPSKRSKELLLENFKKYIINSLDLDIFHSLQNGNLVELFSDNKEIKINKKIYKDTKIYNKIKNNKTLNKIINAYENFIKYLKSDKYIDYTYLWDLFSLPNKKLFFKGINIVILEVTSTNPLDNINIVCPTNYYSKNKFNINIDTCILIKYGDFYEPLYRLYDSPDHSNIEPIFKSDDIQLNHFFIKIKELYENKEKCFPFQLTDNEITYQHYNSNVIIDILNNHNIKILVQIIDIFGKVIGIVVLVGETKIQFIPCFPSNINSKYNVLYSEEFIYNNYQETKEILDILNKKTNNDLKCSVGKKVIEKIKKKEYIIGVLTELNLFVQIDNLTLNNDDEILSEKNKFVYVDKNLKIKNPNNNDINKSVKFNVKNSIKMETLFYNRFKIFVRDILNKNKLLKERIFDLIKSPTLSFKEKEDKIINELNSPIDNNILFVDDRTIITCMQMANLIENKKKECFMKDDKHLLPKNNLVNNKNNKKLYLLKIINEMIRHQQGLYFFRNDK